MSMTRKELKAEAKAHGFDRVWSPGGMVWFLSSSSAVSVYRASGNSEWNVAKRVTESESLSWVISSSHDDAAAAFEAGHRLEIHLLKPRQG